MVKKKSTPSKTSKARAKTPAGVVRGVKKQTTSRVARAAARTHAPSVTNSRRHHTYTHHTSESYRHYSAIMKAIILFLGFVLLLAILANIFAPSIERRPVVRQSQFSNTSPVNRAYYAAPETSGDSLKPSAPVNAPASEYKYVMPEGTVPAPQ